LIIRL